MQRFMLGLDAVVRRRHRLVLVLWVAVLLAALPFALRQSDHLTGGGFGVPGSQSKAVQDAIDHDFDRVQRATLGAVLIPRDGASAGDVEAAVGRLATAVDRTAHVKLAPAARRGALASVARGQSPHTLIVPLAVSVDEYKSTDVARALRERLGLDKTQHGAVSLHLVGQGALWAGLQDLSKKDLTKAEGTGFPIVLVILLVVFGSLAAAALPLALGAVSVLITGALIYALSLVMDMSVFVTNMASMIGIGVAVDYSLFVLARYREEIVAGRSPEQARANALATSGVAVTFSGLTVIVSLAGLWMVNATALRSMALGAILVVAVSVLGAATLLPALIQLLGHRAYRRGRLFTIAPLVLRSRARRRPGSTLPGAPRRAPFWERWSDRVMGRPVVAVVAAAGLLLLLAVPALSLKTTDGALRQFPAGNETRQGFDAAARLAGPGASSPIRVIAPVADVREARTVLAHDPEIVAVAAPVRSNDGQHALLVATPRNDGESPAAKAAVGRLRAEMPSGVRVGGSPATLRDFDHLVKGSLWKIMLFVLALSYLVLMVLLRSVVLPLKAVAMNLLSVGAAYGVLVIVFQWGWIDHVFGTHLATGAVDTITPPLVLAVVFGLSMDYEVFLLSRIRERYDATGDTRRAVGQGLATSARTITSAALIMTAVFTVFVGTGVPSIKQLGLGNAVAIGLDATLVRLVLVPAAMELLGRWNWFMPRRLARVLPRARLEEAPA